MSSIFSSLIDETLLEITTQSRNADDAQISFIENWKNDLISLLAEAPMPASLNNEITLCEMSRLLSPIKLRSKVPSILQKIQADSNFYQSGISLLQQNQTMPDTVFFAVFIDQWQQSIEQAVHQHQTELIEEKRKELLKELQLRNENLEDLTAVVDKELLSNGERLWDLSKGRLTHIDISLLQRFTRHLTNTPELKEIAAQLGRMAIAHVDNKETPNSYETWVLDNSYQDDIPDDMQGVSYSNEISRMLQTEAVNLTFPELEIIFYKRYIERHLLSYQYQGAVDQYKKITQFRDITDDNEENGGPFIICVDSSTSMKGFPELTAKSICYALFQIAFEQKRQCFLMMFSNEVITFPITKTTSLATILTFLSSSFRGGTDLKPVIAKSIELMKGQLYKNADTLIISDFIAQKLPSDLANEIRALKINKNRFHAVCLSSDGNPELMEVFDHIWKYSSILSKRFTQIR
ncbi:hypothetical protein [Psychromonas ossibalaenae]|uniref:hypothetical protein n=1 Tax=Psychromonas ossibalaenae TaxID=444922 RepID=UPI00037F867F|nr:hypothetical protein [Psychromonas ossibalaenae]